MYHRKRHYQKQCRKAYERCWLEFNFQILNPTGWYNIFLNDIFFRNLWWHFSFTKNHNENEKGRKDTTWITTGIRKSSRKKQHLYQKFFLKKTTKRSEVYKQYKNLFGKTKKKVKKLHYQNKIQKSENRIKTTGKVIKEIEAFHENFVKL